MGQIVVDRALDAGLDVVTFDIDEEAVETAGERGATEAMSISDLASTFGDEKRIWLMVPADDPVDAALDELEPSFDTMISSSTAATRTSRIRFDGRSQLPPRIWTAKRVAAPLVPNSGFHS